MAQVKRPAGRLLWEPRGEWPTQLLTELCAELDLVHVVDLIQTEAVTPEQTYYRLHGTAGSRHVHTVMSCAGCVTWSTADCRPTSCSTTCPA
jgi:hypothetical protein